MEEGRSAFKILTGTPAGKRPLGRPRRRWEDNIRMDLKEIGRLLIRGNGLIQLRIGIIGERECGIETPGSITHGVSKDNSFISDLLHNDTIYIIR